MEIDSLLSHGSESRVFSCSFFGIPAVAKIRFPKSYRSVELDKRLREGRTAREARLLRRCERAGIHAPQLLWVSKSDATLVMTRIEGQRLQELLNALAVIKGKDDDENVCSSATLTIAATNTNATLPKLSMEDRVAQCSSLLYQAGKAIGSLHQLDAIHGDLTPCNMIQRSSDGAMVLIDFGLVRKSSRVSHTVEDQAVDLYVFEKSLATLPLGRLPLEHHCAFELVLKGYETNFEKEPEYCQRITRRLEVVRTRGRKKTMVG